MIFVYGARIVETPANLPNWYSALCWRPVTRAQTRASYSALYRFGRLSETPRCHAFIILPASARAREYHRAEETANCSTISKGWKT